MFSFIARVGSFLAFEEKVATGLDKITEKTKEPGYTPYSFYILTLGASTGILSIVFGVYLKRLPFAYGGIALAVSNSLGAYSIKHLILKKSSSDNRKLLSETDQLLNIDNKEFQRSNDRRQEILKELEEDTAKYKQAVASEERLRSDLENTLQNLSAALTEAKKKTAAVFALYAPLVTTVSNFIEAHGVILTANREDKKTVQELAIAVKEAESLESAENQMHRKRKKIITAVEEMITHPSLHPNFIRRRIKEMQDLAKQTEQANSALKEKVQNLGVTENALSKEIKELEMQEILYKKQIADLSKLLPSASKLNQIMELKSKSASQTVMNRG